MKARTLALVAVVAMLAFAAPAAAQTYAFPTGPTLASQGKIVAGGTITVSGGGYKPGSTVTCTVNGVVVDTATVAADGTFICRVKVPAGLAGKSIVVKATGIDPSGKEKVQTLEANVLASTGGDTRTLLTVALAAVVAGGLLFSLGRRRALVRA